MAVCLAHEAEISYTASSTMAGIISYGTYIPKYRLKTADIAAFWNRQLGEALGVAHAAAAAPGRAGG